MKQVWIVIAAAGALAGCSEKAPVETAGETGGSAPQLEQVVQAAPAPQAAGVAAARSEAKPGEPVVLTGRVKDFVDGAAAFTVVDSSVPSCVEMGDGCTTPWDYCCIPADKMAQNTAMVKVVGSGETPLPGSVKGVRSIDHLTTVTIEGTARKDDAGNLTVDASKIYVNPAQ